MRGVFISLEGSEGVGKSTQRNALLSYLREKNIDVLETREPGGPEVSERIRSLLLDKSLPSMHVDTELLLMFASRAEHVQKTILPALEAGKWVVSDRFVDASYAYQGYGRGIDLERIARLDEWTLQGFAPDLTLLLDLDSKVGDQRVEVRGERDRFELEQAEFFERVRAGYKTLAEMHPQRFHVIDAGGTIEEVSASIKQCIRDRFSI